ncbi:MAG TPA: substrate-binding domain-containing protein [Candidatus Nanopelagicaceae bacterium]
MPKRHTSIVLAFATAALLVTGLATTTASAASAGFVGVILPDATSTGRWESADRPLLTAAFKAANVAVDIENSDGDVAAFQTIADQMLLRGAKVLILVNLDSASAKAVQDKAKKMGVPTIDYDRLTLKGSQSYYVSFNNITVGRLQALSIKSCLNLAHKKTARIVYLNGAADDNNATLMKKGYDSILRPLIKLKAYTLVADNAVPGWDIEKAGTIFEQQLSKAGGKLDAVVAANEGLGLAAIAVLQRSKLNGKVCVSSQVATVDGLRAILTSDLFSGVYGSIKAEANAATNLAVALIRGTQTTSATSLTNNGLVNIPSVLLTPIIITKANLKVVLSDGFPKRADVCKGLEAICKRYRI